jgi:hypothetical protein
MEASQSTGRWGRRSLAVAVAVVIVVATLSAVGVWYYERVSQSATEPKADGPTFYQAISAVNASVNDQPRGPWTLYAVWGIAAPIPFSPNALGWASNNLSVNTCGTQFNGITLWNGSIPLFNGSFDSGTAPFWQFAFFSNVSQSILIATDVLSVTHVYLPMLMTSTCADATALGFQPWDWANLLTPFPADSPAMAQSAWSSIGEYWRTANQPTFEAYVLGWSYWGSANPQGLIVKFARCGEVGYTGVQPVTYAIFNSDGTLNSEFNGTQGCGDVISLGPPPVYGSYALYFSSSGVSQETNGIHINQSFQVTHGNRSDDSDAGGLVSWMLNLNLTGVGGSRLASSVPECASWVPSLSDCPANSSGWYAVLLSSSGSWLDSYPSSPNGTAWEIPSTSLVSNQDLVVVAPGSWNMTGDVLSVNGTVPVIVVGGSVAL